MFGLGASELIVIAVVALLFLGPDKLPGAAKAIGRGLRDLKRQTRDLQDTIEHDAQIGDAVRDLRAALNGQDAPPFRPRPAPESLPRTQPAAVPRTTGGEPATDPAGTDATTDVDDASEPPSPDESPNTAHG